MTTIWQVRLFNGPILVDASGNETRRFRSHKVGALLAYLALKLGRPCPREELYEALWPEEATAAVANRFRVTLASLRRHLEPEGVVIGAVLDVSEPGRVRLRAETVTCDAGEYERLLRNGQNEQAARLVTGPLLPGFYEEWAVAEQARYELLTEDLAAVSKTLLSHVSHARAEMRVGVAEPARTIQTDSSPADSTPTDSIPTDLAALAHFNSSLPFYLTRIF